MWHYLRYLIPFVSPEVRSWTWEARLLNWLTCIWLALGLITLFSASYPEGIVNHSDGFYTLKRQGIGILLGILGFNFITRKPLKETFKFSAIFLLLFLVLIFLTTIVGTEVNGAKSWIPLGPFSLQPSEMIKPFLVMQSAYVFARWQKLEWNIRTTWLIIFTLVLTGILLQPNLSTTALCGMSLWLIAVAAELPWIQLISVSFGGLLLATLSVYRNPYQLTRIVSFLDPWQDAQGDGYQLIQSLLAVASGGLTGSGLGLSQQKLSYLPIRTTDFIFAVYAEEFGFIGCLVLLLAFCLICQRLLHVALTAKDNFGSLMAIGVLAMIVFQMAVNIGMTIGLAPVAGIPLPFMSYGRSAMLANFVGIGLIESVANFRHLKKY